MSVKVAHLPSDIANARSIHQHQDGAIQLSQKTGKRACACLAGIFPQAHISAMVKTVFDRPVVSDEPEQTFWWSVLHRETTQPIHHFTAKLMGFQEAYASFEAKHLLDAFPLVFQLVIEIGATGDLAMLQAPMTFLPGFGLLSSPSIRARVLKEIGNILVGGRLVLLGDQEIVPS